MIPKFEFKMAPPVFILVVVFATLVVRFSEGASVQLPVTSALPISTEENVMETIESLAASKILMDRTSPMSPSRIQKIMQTSSIPSKLSTKLDKVVSKEGSFVKNSSNSESERGEIKVESMISPLHVAQCRATCLDKFLENTAPVLNAKGKMDAARVVPNLLRLKRKKRASPSGHYKLYSSCLQESSECLSCWKSCQLFETISSTTTTNVILKSSTPSEHPEAVFSPDSSTPSHSSRTLSGGKVISKPDAEEEMKSKHPILACSNNNNCMAGCQVACSFYEVLTKNGAESEGLVTKMASDEPVVATKQESVVKFVPGKITWPEYAAGQGKSSPVVYVAIQEYPDRKWRLIAQTTELELDIPSELTVPMRSKLRSVRVLVVTPKGLQSVYSPEMKFAQKSGKAIVVATADEENEEATNANEMTVTTTEAIGGNINSGGNGVNVNGGSESDHVVTYAPQEDIETTQKQALSEIKPLELRLVSLIHQKSLVIAELRWDEIGGDPSQEYLITWELTGGGLKGHLVTDSTSVTLSLWPDTTYQIQVEQFQQNFLDSDGEQPEIPQNSASSSPKSLPMIVDTSMASFPLERPSALLSSKNKGVEEDDEEEDYEHEDDEFAPEESDEEEFPGHPSIGQVLAVAFASLVLVLAILSLVAFTLIKLRVWSVRLKSCEKVDESSDSENGENDCFWCCFNGDLTAEEKDPKLLASQENLYSEESTSFYSSPLHYVLSLKKSQNSRRTKKCQGATLEFPPKKVFPVNEHNTNGQHDPSSSTGVVGVPEVAVISYSSSSAEPRSQFDGYYNHVFNSLSTSFLAPAANPTRNYCSS